MIIQRLSFLAVASAAFVSVTSSAFAWDARHHDTYSASYFASAHAAPTSSSGVLPLSTVRIVGAPVATQTRAEVLYVVPVIPTLLGIRPAPVGQPVIYVIDQPDQPASQRHSRSRASASESASNQESGPRVLSMEP